MPGYMLVEEQMMRPYRSNGIKPNPVRMGLLDYLRELRHEVFPFNEDQQLRIVGLEDVLLAAGETHYKEAELFIRRILVSKANELDSCNLGWVQMVFRRPLRRANDFWFDVGGRMRVSLRPIFGSPVKETDASGNEYYLVGFNLT
jgi:hypothetical protein